MKLKQLGTKFLQYSLLIIFLGYYGSITLFPHCHIVNGVSIVHSHPFNSSSDKNPINHSHSKDEFVLIHLLTTFLFTFSFIYFLSEVLKVVLKNISGEFLWEIVECIFFNSHGLRAPPVK